MEHIIQKYTLVLNNLRVSSALKTLDSWFTRAYCRMELVGFKRNIKFEYQQHQTECNWNIRNYQAGDLNYFMKFDWHVGVIVLLTLIFVLKSSGTQYKRVDKLRLSLLAEIGWVNFCSGYVQIVNSANLNTTLLQHETFQGLQPFLVLHYTWGLFQKRTRTRINLQNPSTFTRSEFGRIHNSVEKRLPVQLSPCFLQ